MIIAQHSPDSPNAFLQARSPTNHPPIGDNDKEIVAVLSQESYRFRWRAYIICILTIFTLRVIAMGLAMNSSLTFMCFDGL